MKTVLPPIPLMQLCGDIAGLALHPIGVRLPRFEESRKVCLRDVKDIDQDQGDASVLSC